MLERGQEPGQRGAVDAALNAAAGVRALRCHVRFAREWCGVLLACHVRGINYTQIATSHLPTTNRGAAQKNSRDLRRL
jgi:hypothetical protein